MSDKILLNFLKQKEYTTTANNVIGDTTDQTLRTLDTISGDTAYVRKFGTDYEIKQVTDITDPVDGNMTFTVKASDGTTLGSRTGGGAFTAGSTLSIAQSCYLVISASGGAVTVLASITIDTDVDAGGLAFTCAAETVADTETLTLYLSDTGSTYYDSSYMYGGDRHTPALNNTRKPYFTITTALAALATANNDGIIVLDSATYDEDIDLTLSDFFLLAALGQTPTITRGIGARVTRDTSMVYNNTTAVFFNENGDDATGDGTWHNPFEELDHSVTNRGGLHVVYGGIGATESGYTWGTQSTYTIATGGFRIESDYGYMPFINRYVQYEGTAEFRIYGLKLYAFGTDRTNSTGDMYIIDNTMTSNQGIPGIATYENNPSATITYYIRNNHTYRGIEYVTNTSTTVLYLEKNYINGSITSPSSSTTDAGHIGIYLDDGVGAGDTVTAYIRDNIFVNLKYCIGFEILGTLHANSEIHNNTLYNFYRGIYFEDLANFTAGCVSKIIAYGNNVSGGYGAFETATNITLTYCDFYNVDTTVSGNITYQAWTGKDTDPQFCSLDSDDLRLGLSANSLCFKTDGSENDTGAMLYNILISNNDIVINGFNIEQTYYNNAIAKTGATDYTGLIIKWCSIHNSHGISIDNYSGSDTDSQILNCKLYNNGNGIKLTYGGNTVQECLIYNNLIFGIHSDYTFNEFNHNVFYLNKYNLYLESNSANITYINNISNNGSLYGIYSEVFLSITYSCITDAVTTNVIIVSSNVLDFPLFVDPDNEDFHLKSIALGYTINSPCLDRADDGYDMGAYLDIRTISNEYWQKFRLLYNPLNLNILLAGKGNRNFTDGEGNKSLYSKAHRRQFPMIWGNNSATDTYNGDGIQRKTLEYINTLYPTRENGLTRNDIIVRISLMPDDYLDYGSNATIDSSELTLTDSAKSWVLNEWKGYHVGVKFDSGTATGSITASTKKLLVAPSPGWTNDEWIGYYIFYNDLFYYITDNDADELTLSDPDDTLSNVSNINWSIDKYFLIASNTATVLTLEDDDSELVTGTYDWYINFIETAVSQEKFKYNQKIWAWLKEHSKSGYKITFEEFHV